jgi:hypothetical protein
VGSATRNPSVGGFRVHLMSGQALCSRWALRFMCASTSLMT